GDPAEIEVRDGRLGDFSFEESCQLGTAKFGALSTAGSYRPPRIGGPFKGSGVGPSPAYSYSACVVDAGADARTGVVTVNRVWIAPDVGRALNPLLVIGQVEGSAYMGLGEARVGEQTYLHGPP